MRNLKILFEFFFEKKLVIDMIYIWFDFARCIVCIVSIYTLYAGVVSRGR